MWARLFERHDAPELLPSDNGQEFVQHALQAWLPIWGVQTLTIEPGSPWQNGKSESMHGKLRDGYLERELFNTRIEARCLVENYRVHFNTQRPHSALNYQTPDEFAQNWKLNQNSLLKTGHPYLNRIKRGSFGRVNLTMFTLLGFAKLSQPPRRK